MTAARLGAEHAHVVDERPAHAEVVGRLRAARGRAMWGHEAETVATIAHYAFGALAGVIYAILAPRRARPASGVAYASTIWAVSYHRILPRLGLMPRPSRDDSGRQVVLEVDHVLYGLALDAFLESLERRGPLRARA
jgi:hypothetical protein